MQQYDLWQSLNPRPLARKSDPSSSHEAAKRVAVRAGSQAAQILACLRREGVAMTAEQISEGTEIAVYDVRKRCPDPLERRGLVQAINRKTMRSGDVLRWLAVREG